MIDFKDIKFDKKIELKLKSKVDNKIEFNTKWDLVKIGSFAETSSGGTPLSSIGDYYNQGTIPWINSGEVRQGVIIESENKITQKGLENSSAKIFPINTVLVAMYGATAGQVGILGIEASTNQAVCGILPNEKYIPKYLYFFLDTQLESLLSLRAGTARLNLSQDVIKNFKIPLPPIEIQEKIIEEVIKVEREKGIYFKDGISVKDFEVLIKI